MTETTKPKKHRANTVRLVVRDAMPGTQQDIHAKTGVSLAAISRWCEYLHDCEDAHIGGWQRSAKYHGVFMAVYHPGPGADVKCPYKPRTQRDRDRDSRRTRRKSGEWEDRKARERAYYWAKKGPRRDPLTAALFGSVGVTAH